FSQFRCTMRLYRRLPRLECPDLSPTGAAGEVKTSPKLCPKVKFVSKVTTRFNDSGFQASLGRVCCMAQRILIVDDERTLCEMLAEALSRAGYTVNTAYNVRSAKEI